MKGSQRLPKYCELQLALVRARTDVLTARHDHYVAYANRLVGYRQTERCSLIRLVTLQARQRISRV